MTPAEPFDTQSAEQAYLFRHALLRDAAYELQLPADRAKLHALAALLIEDFFAIGADKTALDPHAMEIAHHLSIARQHADSEDLLDKERAMTRRAAEYCEKHFRNDAATHLWQRLARIGPPVEAAGCFLRAAATAGAAGRTVHWEALLHEGLAAAREHQDRPVEIRIMESLAVLYRNGGKIVEGADAARQALALSEQGGDPRSVASSLKTLASMLEHAGQTADAESAAKRAMSLCGELGSGPDDQRLRGIVCAELGSIYQVTGRVTEAAAYYETSRLAFRRAGYAHGECAAIENIAATLHEQGRLPEAEAKYEETIVMARRIGDPRALAAALANLALLLTETGRFDDAEAAAVTAVSMRQELGEKRGEGIALVVLAGIRHKKSALADSLALLTQALSIHREVGNRRWEAITLGSFGGIEFEQGRYESAASYGYQAVRIAGEVKDLRTEAGERCKLGRTCLAISRPEEARENWVLGARQLRQQGLVEQLQNETAAMRQACAKAGVPPFDGPDGQPGAETAP